MIIWGWRSFVKALAVLTLVCPQCHNPAAHRLVQRSRWFTLFFIPLIPLGATRFTTCTFCGHATKVTKEQAAEMVAAAQGQVAAPQAPAPVQYDPAQQQVASPAPDQQYPPQQ